VSIIGLSVLLPALCLYPIPILVGSNPGPDHNPDATREDIHVRLRGGSTNHFSLSLYYSVILTQSPQLNHSRASLAAGLSVWGVPLYEVPEPVVGHKAFWEERVGQALPYLNRDTPWVGSDTPFGMPPMRAASSLGPHQGARTEAASKMESSLGYSRKTLRSTATSGRSHCE